MNSPFLTTCDFPFISIQGFSQGSFFGLGSGNENSPGHFRFDYGRPCFGLRSGIEGLPLDRMALACKLSPPMQIAPLVEGRHHRLLFRQGLFVLSAQCSKIVPKSHNETAYPVLRYHELIYFKILKSKNRGTSSPAVFSITGSPSGSSRATTVQAV